MIEAGHVAAYVPVAVFWYIHVRLTWDSVDGWV